MKETQETQETSWSPPQHWISVEELQKSYWEDPERQKKRGQEFFEKPEELEKRLSTLGSTELARSEFLTIMGAGLAMAGAACAKRPIHKIIPYVAQPEEFVPGNSYWYASTCGECSSHCGILVKEREGRPIKIEGNPQHPVNRGKLCSQGQASVFGLYDVDRLKQPVVVEAGVQKGLTWEQVDQRVVAHLKKQIAQGSKLRILTGEIHSPSTQKLIHEFLSLFGDARWIQFDSTAPEEIATAQELSYGNRRIPQYYFNRAELVVSLQADFLGNWLSPVEHAHAWSRGRKLLGQKPETARISRLVSIESALSLTGSNADERWIILPGQEVSIALSLASILVLEKGLMPKLLASSGWKELLEQYTPEKVAASLAQPELKGKMRALANELYQLQGKSLIVAGGLAAKTELALELQVVTNLLNSVLQNEGHTLEAQASFQEAPSSLSAFLNLLTEMEQGEVQTLIVHRSNPFYSMGFLKDQLEKAFKKVSQVIVIDERVHETGLEAHLVLPDFHALESWGDFETHHGTLGLQQPTIAPLFSSRSFQDNLIFWAKQCSASSKLLLHHVPDWHAFLMESWKQTVYPNSKSAASFQVFWESVLREGFYQKKEVSVVTPRAFMPQVLQKLSWNTKAHSGVQLLLYAKNTMGQGQNANNSWLQELPEPLTSVTWDNQLNISPQLAKSLGIEQDDVIELSAQGLKMELPAYIQPGLHPEVVSAAIGYGRKAVGKVGNGCGIDVFPWVRLNNKNQNLVFTGSEVQLRKTGKFYQLATTQWHTATEKRAVLNDISLVQYRKNPAALQEGLETELRMEEVPTIWKPHVYSGYRWGMGIDLSSCTGCGACMVACQAENNVAVVGRDQVRNSRQMHWIRIDRYYSGAPEQPEVVFQPMLCQHCENAPCETVCPVLATIHDDEGLNVQIYNRCVGTRYCQNNCPYKVRRFNFFDHWKSYHDTLNLVWNPDVSVRIRGVMEKCTFCDHRIRDAKDKAKDYAEKVKDGDFQVACQQTCPTDAIVFGDLNDPQSTVSQWKKSPQSFRVLEVLNTRPAISYLTKVRNKEASV